MAAGAVAIAPTLGFEVQSIPFEPSHAVLASSHVPEADVLLVVGNFAEERAVAPILLTRAFRFVAFV